MCQRVFAVRRVCWPTLYWLRMRPVVRISGEVAVRALLGGHVFGQHELALAAHEAVDMHDRRAVRVLLIDRPLQEPSGSSRAWLTPEKVGVRRAISAMISAALA